MNESQKCLCCDDNSSIEMQHWPVPSRHGGTHVIPLCKRCHTAADRMALANWDSKTVAEGFVNAWGNLSVDGRLVLMKLTAILVDLGVESDHDIAQTVARAFSTHERNMRGRRISRAKQVTTGKGPAIDKGTVSHSCDERSWERSQELIHEIRESRDFARQRIEHLNKECEGYRQMLAAGGERENEYARLIFDLRKQLAAAIEPKSVGKISWLGIWR